MATRPRTRQALVRRLGASVALLAYLAAALGVPLPAAPPLRKNTSQPFPCQDHACGCQSAEECWRGCCCFSPEERWAWAAAHHVDPPAYAERPAAAGWSGVPLRARGNHAAGRCCSEKKAEPKACHDGCCHAGQAAPEPAPNGPRWLMTVSTLRCRGLATLWVSGAALPPPEVLAWVPWLPVAEAAYSNSSRPVCVSRTPPSPPPRFPLV